MLTIFHRYSKSTFTIFFSARVADLHLFKASFLVFGCFLRQIHLLLSFPPQAQGIIFFSQTSYYFLYEDSCKLCLVHGHSKSTFFTFFSARMAVLHVIFTASLRFEIFPSVHHTSYCIFHHEDLFFSTSADRTIHPSRECLDLTCLLHTSPLQHLHQS